MSHFYNRCMWQMGQDLCFVQEAKRINFVLFLWLLPVTSTANRVKHWSFSTSRPIAFLRHWWLHWLVSHLLTVVGKQTSDHYLYTCTVRDVTDIYRWRDVATFCNCQPVSCGPGSVVGITTGYWLDGPGIESRWGRDFPRLSRPALGPTQPSVQ